MKIVLLGAPGAGKGLQAKLIVEYLKVPPIATGDMFRQMAKEQDPLGVKLKEYFDLGNLVPDDITIKVVKRRLEKPDCKLGFILDGFPRTLIQAERLEEITKLNHVLLFEVPDKEIIDRLAHRENCDDCKITYGRDLSPKQPHICDNCSKSLSRRVDDNPESIKTRLQVYREKTQPLIRFYESRGLLRKIEGHQSYKTVADDVRIILGAWTL